MCVVKFPYKKYKTMNFREKLESDIFLPERFFLGGGYLMNTLPKIYKQTQSQTAIDEITFSREMVKDIINPTPTTLIMLCVVIASKNLSKISLKPKK